MPDQKHHQRNVTFDKKEIVDKHKITFKEARRLKGPIYEALTNELNEEGCPIAASHLKHFIQKEAAFFARGIIIQQLSDAERRPLLLAVFDHLKKAEQAAQLKHCGGLAATFRLLLQALNLLEPLHQTFDWVLEDMYEIVVGVCEKYEGEVGTSETIARIFFVYGQYRDDIQRAATYLEKALNLARGQCWILENTSSESDYEPSMTLSQAVAREYTKVLIKLSRQKIGRKPAEAIEIAKKAILAIASVGAAANLMLFYRANLAHAKALSENHKLDEALKILKRLGCETADATDEPMLNFSIKVSLHISEVYSNLNNHHAAWSALRKALSLSRKHGYKSLEARTLLNIGKLFAKVPSLGAIAKQAYASAKKLYVELNDNNAKIKTGYLLAKLQADTMFPFFLDALKGGDSQYCCLYNLRRWKNQNIPFWNNIAPGTDKTQPDPIYCLLEKEWAQVRNGESFE